jgi:hypothetical protein
MTHQEGDTGMMTRRFRWVAGWVLVANLLVGCTSVAAEISQAPDPAQVEPIEGSDRSRVILTDESAQRVGIQTEAIAAADSGAAGSLLIPLTAVLYDKDGKTWAYTNPEALTFVPVELVIAAVNGDRAVLSSGPPVGTQVVTVGGAELLGAEYGVPGE